MEGAQERRKRPMMESKMSTTRQNTMEKDSNITMKVYMMSSNKLEANWSSTRTMVVEDVHENGEEDGEEELEDLDDEDRNEAADHDVDGV